LISSDHKWWLDKKRRGPHWGLAECWPGRNEDFINPAQFAQSAWRSH
jgi:hypothetical protein